MSQSELRELLHDRVADETTVDLSARAWRTGRAIRRRRSMAVVGGVGAGAVAVSGIVAWVDSTPTAPASGGPTFAASSSTTDLPTTAPTPDVLHQDPSPRHGPRYQGADTWWLGGLADESRLPVLDGTGLPREIDLSPDLEPVETGPVVALLGVVPDGPLARVTAVGTDGQSRSLDVARLRPVADEQGNTIAPLVSESLSPDGERVFFVQERSLEVYTFATGEWTSIETPAYRAEAARWFGDTELWVPDEQGGTSGTSHDLDTGRTSPVLIKSGATHLDHRGGEGFGPVVGTDDAVAQAVFLSENATSPDGTTYGGLDAVSVTVRGRTLLLVLDGPGERWKGCCPAVGMIDDTVLFESRSEQARVLAWDAGTERVRQVTRIVGWVPGQESYVASWRVLLGS